MTDARPGLRTRHSDQTREAILRSLVEIVAEGGLPDFSVQQVADRAGVSHRTVYRHYPSREDLINGLMGWVEARIAATGGRFGTPDTETLPSAARTNLQVFDALADSVEALTRFSLAIGHEPEQRRQRNTLFVDMMATELDTEDPARARAVAAVLRMLVSTRAWLVLRQDGIVPDEHVAPTLTWAVEILLAAARDGNLPTLDPESAQVT